MNGNQRWANKQPIVIYDSQFHRQTTRVEHNNVSAQ
jgi:hypothetical protein